MYKLKCDYFDKFHKGRNFKISKFAILCILQELIIRKPIPIKPTI